MKSFLSLLLCVCVFSCQGTRKEQLATLMEQWENKTIYFPDSCLFISYEGDSILQNKMIGKGFSIVSYVDSIGCMSCKLHLEQWKEIIAEFDTLTQNKVNFLFFFNPKDKRKLIYTLKRENFSIPVFIDEQDNINKMNHFPSDIRFQTFLLDKANKVIAVGNPAHNYRIRELYRNIICGKKERVRNNLPLTSVSFSDRNIDMGEFPWQEKKEILITISNVGDFPLIINDIIASCNCMIVEYEKIPVQSFKSATVILSYKAEKAEYFNKTLTVYCNAKGSPFKITITGRAK